MCCGTGTSRSQVKAFVDTKTAAAMGVRSGMFDLVSFGGAGLSLDGEGFERFVFDERPGVVDGALVMLIQVGALRVTGER